MGKEKYKCALYLRGITENLLFLVCLWHFSGATIIISLLFVLCQVLTADQIVKQ